MASKIFTRADVIAGITTAILLVPQAMAYALLAGLPPQFGLYASCVPLLVYAALGTSRRLAIGPVAIDSLLVAAAVAPLAVATGLGYQSLALTLTLMVGTLQALMGLARLGFVANFLSRPVLGGFTSATALLIASSQIGALTGVTLPRGRFDEVVMALVARSRELHWPTLAFGLTALVGMWLLEIYFKRFPRALALVAIATLTSALLDVESAGVALVGAVPSGLPEIAAPLGSISAWQALMPAAVSIAVVSFVESLSVAQYLARSDGQDVNPNRELLAVGGANIASSFFGGYVVSGGLSRSAINAEAGAQSRVAGIVTALCVGLTLMFFTPLFRHLPKAVLAAIVLSAALRLIDGGQARRLWTIKRSDFGLLLLSFGVTLLLGVQLGLALGVGSSVVLFLVKTTRPHAAVLGRLPGTDCYRNVKRFPEAEVRDDLLIVRVDAQFYFGNVTFLKRALDELRRERSSLRAIVLDASGMNQLDSSALDALLELDERLRNAGVSLLFAEVKGPVRDVLERSGWLSQLQARGRIFLRVHDAVLSLPAASVKGK